MSDGEADGGADPVARQQRLVGNGMAVLAGAAAGAVGYRTWDLGWTTAAILGLAVCGALFVLLHRNRARG